MVGACPARREDLKVPRPSFPGCQCPGEGLLLSALAPIHPLCLERKCHLCRHRKSTGRSTLLPQFGAGQLCPGERAEARESWPWDGPTLLEAGVVEGGKEGGLQRPSQQGGAGSLRVPQVCRWHQELPPRQTRRTQDKHTKAPSVKIETGDRRIKLKQRSHSRLGGKNPRTKFQSKPQ